MIMAKTGVLGYSTTALLALCFVVTSTARASETVLSAVLTPTEEAKTGDQKVLSRQSRSGYYDPRYYGRQFLERLTDYDRPRCGRCLDDRYDDRDDPYDRSNRDRYDDDRRGGVSHRPTYGNRLDRNKNYGDRDDESDRRYSASDRRNGAERKNGTNEDPNDDSRDKRPYDDKEDDKRPSGGRRGGDRERDRNRNRYDDRDRYRPDYYDRFLRDPYRERVPYDYEDPYRERRPLFDRYPYGEEDYGGRYNGYSDYRRPAFDDRVGAYDDRVYGGRGRGPHDSFRPWDETYRGQAGFDAGGRGYYFASGRPEVAAAPSWDAYRGDYSSQYPREYASQYPREYVRPESYNSGWQNVDRPVYGGQGYRDPALSYQQAYGYRQDLDSAYRPASGWQNVGERRPYRDQSSQLGKRGSYGQSSGNAVADNYGQSGSGGTNNYGQGGGSANNYGQAGGGGTNAYPSSSTTPGTSYLYQREDERVTEKESDVTTKPPS